jgi:ubiquitin carboxyl-terminal hydrolase 7
MTILLTWHTAVDVIRNNMAARQTDLRLYLDVIPDPSKVRLTVYDFTHTLIHFA